MLQQNNCIESFRLVVDMKMNKLVKLVEMFFFFAIYLKCYGFNGFARSGEVYFSYLKLTADIWSIALKPTSRESHQSLYIESKETRKKYVEKVNFDKSK